MDNVIAYAKLPLKIDVPKAQQEVIECMGNEKRHFNTLQYTGEWTVVALRSPGGLAEAIVPDARGNETFADTALMKQCLAVKELVQSFRCPVMAVRLLNLKKGAVIKEHRDTDLSFEKGEARLHFPIFTNPQVAFYVEGNRVDMREGECWYINANMPHRVANLGSADRIHLVIDCKVNDWLKSIFDAAQATFAPVAHKTDVVKMMISELRAQNTETANRMANELENGLHLKDG